MAEKSDYDFVGAYHHDERGGLLHVADHHVSPGKKQWSWGYGDFGQAWDRNLTDENGPYIELMTGVFTDNQPDFTWLAPYEEKVFVQNFLPYSELGMVQNANTQLALKLVRESGQLQLGVYAIAPLNHIVVELSADHQPLYETQLTLKPGESWQQTLPENGVGRLALKVKTAENQPLLDYQEHITQQTPLPEPAIAPALPEAIHNGDELYFIGQHLEQYNHASRYAGDYYRRAVELDPQDYRNNVALGTLAFNSADWALAEQCARAALQRAHRLNKNPRDGEASMLLASVLERMGDDAGAWDHYYKASWSGNCRDAAWWSLARLAMKRGDVADALEKVNTSLRFNASNPLAMGLKALALANSGQKKAALEFIFASLEQYPLSYPLHCARWMIERSDDARETLLRITGRRGVNASLLAGWLLSIGQTSAVKEVLAVLDSQEALPMLWRASLSDDANERQQFIAAAEHCHAHNVRFPNSLDEVQMLQSLGDSAFARYLLGCFWYSKRRYDEAVSCWRETLEKSPDYAPAHRLLGVYSWNKQQDATQALAYLQRAVALEPDNARFLFELDFLQKLLARPVHERLTTLVEHKAVVLKRDDLTAELLSLWNASGHYADAAAILDTRVFHPWEGGEGKITGQYLLNQLHRALQFIERGAFKQATDCLKAALRYPDNLGEGRLPGQTDNDIWYLLGYCAEQAGDAQQAAEYYQLARQGGSTLDAGRYYNDQPADYLFWQGIALRKSGNPAQAEQHFRHFIDWAAQHRDDVPQVDFFAVSLPDLVVLDVSAQQRHLQHCLFIEALGHLGLGNVSACQQRMQQLLQINPAHDKAHLIRHALQSGIFS
ncbi:Lipopolysaccharide assembly protein B [Klebsiella pneumoniae]|nr:Lipopolysaccharide assembly protein B [Klebsiella pneumoniae]CAH3634218.1 Lipopolysaccharide assembly protein B [Klebsiella pneumoniae]